MDSFEKELKNLQFKIRYLATAMKDQSSANEKLVSEFRTMINTRTDAVNSVVEKFQIMLEDLTVDQKEAARNIGSVKEECAELRQRQATFAGDFESKMATIKELQRNVTRCFSKLDEQSAATKADVIASLNWHTSEHYRKQDAKNQELEKSISRIESGQKEMVSEYSKFVNQQTELQKVQENVNKDLSTKLVVLKNMMKDTIEQNQKKLAQQYVEFVADQTNLHNRQQNVNEHFSAKLLDLKSQVSELDHYIVSKINNQMALDASAAKEFHLFAYEKYSQLETTCTNLQLLLEQISIDQKEIADKNTWLFKDQADSRYRLDKVEDEQSECKCSEMRKLLNKSVKDRERLVKENYRLGEQQDALRRRLAKTEKTLEEQGSVISELSESLQEENSTVHRNGDTN